ncbi:MAG TPA: phosphotransferase [Pyrinomonadaceae bacterium]|nr:phosphotransferase [Pyrinomonadaceae bacterium]
MNHTSTVPPEIIERAASELGSRVAGAQALVGGYTPQRLCRLVLADGRSAVLKAAGPNEDAAQSGDSVTQQVIVWTEVLRKEISVYRDTPHLARWRPLFLGSFEENSWVALLLEDLSGAGRVPPWTAEAIGETARGLAEFHAATLGGSSERKTVLCEDTLRLFARIRERGRHAGDLPANWDTDAWWNWLASAADAGEATFAAGVEVDEPHCFTHFDVRSDNMFLREGRLVLIDWSSGGWGPPFIDSVYWALGVEIEGGPPAPGVHEQYLARANFASPGALKKTLAFCAAFFVNGLQVATAPPAVQSVRRRFLAPTLRWFAETHDLDAPPFA